MTFLSKPHGALSVIMMCGPPGCGKSSLSRALHTLIRAAGGVPVWINQDEAGGYRRLYLEKIQNAMVDPSNTHIILDKGNMQVAQRDDYHQLQLKPVVTFWFFHPGGDHAMLRVCMDRIKKRGMSHRTLRTGWGGLSKKRISGIVKQVVSQAVRPEDHSVVDIDVSLSPTAAVEVAWKELQQRVAKPYSGNIFDLVSAEVAVERSMKFEERILSSPSSNDF